MSNEVMAISASRGAYRETADGSLEVKLIIDPRFIADFHRIFKIKDMPCALAPLVAGFERNYPDPGPEPKQKQTGNWVAALYKAGWFNNPHVLAVLGTDDAYRAWVQKQPSAFSGGFSEYVDGEGRCIAAHVRRAGESGTGYKAPYACVPITNDEHQRQHKEGESALGGKEWFDKMRAKYVAEWGHGRLREKFEVDSLTEITQEAFVDWADAVGLLKTLPLALKG